MQRPFVHPAIEDVTIGSVLYALADPTRLEIVKKLSRGSCGLNCSEAAPADLPKSTQSHHFQILREAGLVKSERRGTEVVNALRCAEIEKRFPGVVSSIFQSQRKGEEAVEAARFPKRHRPQGSSYRLHQFLFCEMASSAACVFAE